MPGALLQPTIVEGDTKSFRDPQMIYEKLFVLSGDAMLQERLAVQKGLFDGWVNTGLPAFNKLLADKKIAGVVVPEIR